MSDSVEDHVLASITQDGLAGRLGVEWRFEGSPDMPGGGPPSEALSRLASDAGPPFGPLVNAVDAAVGAGEIWQAMSETMAATMDAVLVRRPDLLDVCKDVLGFAGEGAGWAC